MTSAPMRVGVIGCGNISDTYFQNAQYFTHDFEICACADINRAAAVDKGTKWGLKVMTPAELLASPEVDVVLNLTVPTVHAEITLAALTAGKHVYSEKPLGLSIGELQEIDAASRSRGLMVACAPDTIMGAGIQSARHAIESGLIGKVHGATAVIMDNGMEDWHPNPEFFFKRGGGPVLDMGPYYLAALIELLGPVSSQVSVGSRGSGDRTIKIGPEAGRPIDVEVMTSVRSLLTFQSGAQAVFMASWDVVEHGLPHIEIYGSRGTLTLPDPNWFGGAPIVKRAGEPARAVDLEGFDYGAPNRQLSDGTEVADYRGLGLADLCRSIRDGVIPKLGLQSVLPTAATLLEIADSSDASAPREQSR